MNSLEKSKLKKLVLSDIERKFDKIYNINIQNYSINGYGLYKHEKCFFKIVDSDFFIKEINGYLISYKEIPTMNIIFVKYLDNSKKYLISYTYDKTIRNNSGLLNDTLVKNDFKSKFTDKSLTEIRNVLSMYENIYSNIKKETNYSPSNIFFIERIESRLKKWYVDSKNFKGVNIIIENKKYNFFKILKETINYFEKNKKIKKSCILSQGDPNTLNISTNPCFFDLATAGFNPIVGEVAITLISTLIYDNYFCPKYHPESYYFHDRAIFQLEEYKPLLIAKKHYNNIILKSNIITSKIRKYYINEYIKILKKNNIVVNADIKYYIIMRLLCVFDINKMEKNDYYYSLYLVCFFYSNIKSNFYLDIEKIINEMESV